MMFTYYYDPIVLWLEAIKHKKDIDLHHLWHTTGKLGDELTEWQDSNEMGEEIWINTEKSNSRDFTIGPYGNWAICNTTMYLWNT